MPNVQKKISPESIKILAFFKYPILLLFCIFFHIPIQAEKSSFYSWISTSENIYKASGKNLTVKASGNVHWIVLDKGITYPYEIRFQEKIQPARGSVSFLWNYYLLDAAYKKRLGTGYNQVLSIESGNRIRYYENIYSQKNITSKPGEVRTWRIVNQKNFTAIYLNEKKVISMPADNINKIIPSFAVQLNNTGGQSFQIQNLQILEKPGGTKKKPVIYQYPLPDKSGRNMTVFAHKGLTKEQKSGMKKLPELFHQIELAAGIPITHTEPLLAIYEGPSSGNNLAASPGYPGWLEVGPGFLTSLHLIAHEFAHFYFCIGASCGTGIDKNIKDIKKAATAAVANNWMIEGFASYLGLIALNRMNGESDFLYSEKFGNFAGIMDQMKERGWNDGPLDDGSRIKKKYVVPGKDPIDTAFKMAYGKGYRFFYMIGSEFGHDTFQKIIKHNRKKNTSNYSSRDLMKDLEKYSGRKAEPYFSGWITEGPYKKISPEDFKDKNQNGIMDFTEH
ncbi:MAG: M1 family aminopeptidase [Spirochaetia bacterium]|nr:M1 family aminopeptidase [Spirochaetia bacterium]